MTSFPVILDPELCVAFLSFSFLPYIPLYTSPLVENGEKHEADKGIRESIVRFDRWNGEEEGGRKERSEARRGEARRELECGETRLRTTVIVRRPSVHK